MPAAHAWPFSQVHRLWRISSSWSFFDEGRAVLFDKYLMQGMSAATVQECLALDPRVTNRSKTASKGRVFTLVLDYHPMLARMNPGKVLNKVFSEFKYELENLFGPVAIRIAWRNGAQHLVHKVRMFCRLNYPAHQRVEGWG